MGRGWGSGGIIDGLLALLHFWTPFFMLPIALNMLHDCKREKKTPFSCGSFSSSVIWSLRENTTKPCGGSSRCTSCPVLCTHPAAILTIRCTPGGSAVSLLAYEMFSWCGVYTSVNISSKTSELSGVGVTS